MFIFCQLNYLLKTIPPLCIGKERLTSVKEYVQIRDNTLTNNKIIEDIVVEPRTPVKYYIIPSKLTYKGLYDLLLSG